MNIFYLVTRVILYMPRHAATLPPWRALFMEFCPIASTTSIYTPSPRLRMSTTTTTVGVTSLLEKLHNFNSTSNIKIRLLDHFIQMFFFPFQVIVPMCREEDGGTTISSISTPPASTIQPLAWHVPAVQNSCSKLRPSICGTSFKTFQLKEMWGGCQAGARVHQSLDTFVCASWFRKSRFL